MIYGLSTLNEQKIKNIIELEQKLGKPLLAFSPYPCDAAELPSNELDQIQKLEKDLGVVLIACK
ncbi:MAG: hypothetical protein ACLFUU_02485 [Desulfobacteraceae bacterium]